eukprot:m.69568 g.69568  ORF g.69568 m.69568 type:complete len:52 (-) comp18408_c0_seq2:153-308(-)
MTASRVTTAAGGLGRVSGGAVVISNVQPRVDTAGNVLESGDGSLHKFGERW